MSIAQRRRREFNDLQTKSHENTASNTTSSKDMARASETEAPIKTIQVPIPSPQTEERPPNPKSRMVKEMHKTLTKTVVLETFPRVTVTSRAKNEESPSLGSTTQGSTSNSLRMSEGQVTTMIQAIIEDREEERQERQELRKEASRRLSSKSVRRLGSRVKQAIHSLGFQ
jgi:hypothetical protein